jgi:lipoprotein-anchoring transpeptidase ErfK/SrfK
VRGIAAAALTLGALVGAPAALADDPPPVIQPGVTIQGIAVEGMTALEARAAVHAFAARPFTFTFPTRRNREATPWQVGARSHVGVAVSAALAAPAGTEVPLTVSIDFDRMRQFVAKLNTTLYRAPRNSRVFLHDLRPRLTKSRRGYDVVERRTRTLLRETIKANARGPIAVAYRRIAPAVTPWNFKPVIVIRRGSHRLYLYSGAHMRHRATFGIAVGQPIYPTPLGRWTIVTKQRNPWWYPPDSAWAAGASPIPPGPGNPLGTRWMGLSAPGVGIHGTPDAASIGYSASHGCIRMRIPDAEWLFERVEVGSTVFIRAA